MKLYSIYACSFYSSSLYDLFSKTLDQLYRTWNKSVRILFNVPMDTYTYLIESISNSLHPKVMLSSRFVSFHRNNISCGKPGVRLLSNIFKSDLRTSYGRNLTNISNECNIPMNELTNVKVKNIMKYRVVPENEAWRVPILNELLGSKRGDLDVPLSDEEIDCIIDHACSS